MATITTPDKNAGDQHLHTDYNTMKSVINTNAAAISNVDNTSDANKPVSTAQAAALALKADLAVAIRTRTADYTLQLADNGAVIRMNVGSANYVTVPPNSSVAFPLGTMITVRVVGAGATTPVAGGGVTLSGTLSAIPQYGSFVIHKVNTDEWDLYAAASGGTANVAPVASGVGFTGTEQEGNDLVGSYSYSDADSDAEGATLKQWYRSDNNSGLNRAAISGATFSTYTLQSADVGKYIQFAVTPAALTGTSPGTQAFSTYSGAIAAMGSNVAPVASSVAFTGTQTAGQTLTGTYTYSDADSDAEGTSIKKWYRSDNNSGLNRAAISGATNSTYVLQTADVGKFIQFAVTPVAATGASPGTEVFSSYSGAIGAAGGGLVDLVYDDVLTNLSQTATAPPDNVWSASGGTGVGSSSLLNDGTVACELELEFVGGETNLGPLNGGVGVGGMFHNLYCSGAGATKSLYLFIGATMQSGPHETLSPGDILKYTRDTAGNGTAQVNSGTIRTFSSSNASPCVPGVQVESGHDVKNPKQQGFS